jgi:hypothetical protein
VRRHPSAVARLAAAIAGLILIAVAAVPTIGLFALVGVGAKDSPSASVAAVSSGSARPSGAPSPTPPPTKFVASPDPSGGQSPAPSGSPGPVQPGGSPSPSPSAAAAPLKLDLGGTRTFVSQATIKWCASAAIQNVVNLVTGSPDTSRSFQKSIEASASSYTTGTDSKNSGWGPLGMSAAISNLTQTTYKLKVLTTRDEAVREAVKAVAATRRPAILLAWRGAHAWVVSGYSVDADPLSGAKFTVKALRILDPWYPRISNIWGASMAPGAWHDPADLKRNFLPWRRPEGHYPGRDGKFLIIVPVPDAGA